MGCGSVSAVGPNRKVQSGGATQREKKTTGTHLKPVLVVDENLHDARVNRPEHCLGDDLEVHCVRLPAHLGRKFE